MAENEQEPTQIIPAKDGDIEVPIPSREDFDRLVRKVAVRPDELRTPLGEKDAPPDRSDSD